MYETPDNDSCEMAFFANSLPVIFKGSTLGATPDFNDCNIDTCGVAWYTRGLWYRLEGHGAAVARLEYQPYSKAKATVSSAFSLDRVEVKI